MSTRKEDPMRRRKNFRTCPRCGIAMASGEREQSSKWGGASLPMDLEEYCDSCLLNFFTCQANRPDEHAIVRKHARLTSASA
jgi:hypothetical protein